MSRYNEFKEMGLTDERYFQMMKSFNNNEEFIDEAIEDWGIENVNKGYEIFDFDGTGMLEVNKIDKLHVFEDDEEAVEQAIKDGEKIIPIEELPENFERRYLGWIDTPENRKQIKLWCEYQASEFGYFDDYLESINETQCIERRCETKVQC